jgi:pyrroline-5-carboxylate reductase
MSGKASQPSALLVGCGKMGSALLSGWLASGLVGKVTVVDPAAAPRDFADDARVTWRASAPAFADDAVPDVVLLAVKPQMMGEAAPGYGSLARKGALILSIAAGKTIAGFEQLFGEEAAIVRTMPNTPAAIGRGMTVCVANRQVSQAQRNLADALMSAVGTVLWAAEEPMLDAVTAVSGSGPAYVFLLVEAMAAAGIEAGLPPDMAMRIARETVSGAGELLRQSSEPAEQLRRNVTSPNGTTQAALDVLMAANGMTELMTRAVAAATARSKALAG